MDLGVVIAISGATITIVGALIAVIFWCRGETNGLRKEFLEGLTEMRLENKDFHYRLLEIERSRKVIIRSHE